MVLFLWELGSGFSIFVVKVMVILNVFVCSGDGDVVMMVMIVWMIVINIYMILVMIKVITVIIVWM